MRPQSDERDWLYKEDMALRKVRPPSTVSSQTLLQKLTLVMAALTAFLLVLALALSHPSVLAFVKRSLRGY